VAERRLDLLEPAGWIGSPKLRQLNSNGVNSSGGLPLRLLLGGAVGGDSVRNELADLFRVDGVA